LTTSFATHGAVAAANDLAAAAGGCLLASGGNAVDAALSAAAVMAVVAPHMCGLGGDMFAIVKPHDAPPMALNGSGRAGSGANPERLRSAGLSAMPFRNHVGSVTVPGCVAGWIALHERFASRGLDEIFGRARRLAREGFPVSSTLALASLELDARARQSAFGTPEPLRSGRRLALPHVADVLGAIAERGAAGFYKGPAGIALIELGEGEFSEDDLTAAHADWVQPLMLHALGHDLWTVPPPSQGYLALAGAWIAERLELPGDPNAEDWAFMLIEAARQAAFDRVDVLHERADGTALLAESRLATRVEAAARTAVRGHAEVYRGGGTTYLCAVDGDRTGVSLIMSNAGDFGSHLTLPGLGIFVHNRGIGFSLGDGHPAEYGPRRRPPHTSSPLLATSRDGALAAVLGTKGADAQPQILLELLVRIFSLGAPPGEAVAAPRFILSREATTGFDVWDREGLPLVRVEHGAPDGWSSGLRKRGYTVQEAALGDQTFGNAQVIRVAEHNRLVGAADPRAGSGAFVGL
jgi:gamma-glutamyltranspeptidase/glutathione hydrolase